MQYVRQQISQFNVTIVVKTRLLAVTYNSIAKSFSHLQFPLILEIAPSLAS